MARQKAVVESRSDQPLARRHGRLGVGLGIRLGIRLPGDYSPPFSAAAAATSARGLTRFSIPTRILQDSDSAPTAHEIFGEEAARTVAAIDALMEMRRAEGLALREDILATCTAVREQLSDIEALAGGVVDEYHDRLRTRVDQLLQKGACNLLWSAW